MKIKFDEFVCAVIAIALGTLAGIFAFVENVHLFGLGLGVVGISVAVIARRKLAMIEYTAQTKRLIYIALAVAILGTALAVIGVPIVYSAHPIPAPAPVQY